MGRFLAVTGLAVAIALGAAAQGDDLDTVAARIKTDAWSQAISATTTNGYLTSLGANGRWSDVNYADTSQTNWALNTHLTRMLSMAEAYANPSHSLYQSQSLLDGIRKAYDAFVTLDPRSTNWWYNEIWTPQMLGKTILLVQPQLTAAQITSGTTIIARSYYPRSYNAGTNTGENRQWRAFATVLRGAITHDTTLTSEAFGAISDTFVVTTGEGVQPDGSFHQHGAQLANGSYGLSFSQDAADLSSYAVGTTYAMPAASTEVLVDYLLDGQQWMLRGVSFEATAQGRGISRSSSRNLGNGMASVIDQTMTLTTYRSAELTAMRNRLSAAQASGTASPALALVGHKHFWNSDYTAHHRPGFSATVKVSSTRTLEPESGNAEGLKNLHLADGVNLIQQRGDEYTSIQPIWDWRRLPGTTTEQGTYSLKPTTDWGMPGSAGFAGGVSDGRNGATVLDYSKLNVKAHKAWFFFDDVEVALGAGIDATAATSAVITTLNQTFQKGSVTWGTTSGSTATFTTGTQSRSDVSWVLHDGVGYVFPTPQSVTVQAAVQSGVWTDLATSNTSSTLVTGSVFSLQVNHGTAPSGGSYSYTILPGASGSSVAAYAATPAVRILANTRNLQAARHDGLALTQAAFYASGTLSTGSGATLTVREPSLVMLDESASASTFSVSNPNGLATTIHADVARTRPEGPAEFTRVTIRLSGSDQGGATVSRMLDQPTTRTYAFQLRDTAPASAPLAYRWSFEGATGAERLQNTGTGANATLQAVAYGSEGSTARIGYGMGIDETTTAMSPQRIDRLSTGAGGALLATTGSVSIPTSFTVEALVRPDLMETGGSIGYAVMAGGAATNNRGYFVVNQEGAASDTMSTIVGDSISQTDNVGRTLTTFTPGHWYYVANTYTVSGSLTTMNSYVADLTAGQTSVTQAVANQVASGKPLTAAQMAIGGYFVSGTAQEAWSGSIDEVSMFGRVLSGAEVQARLSSLYAAPAQVSWSAAASGTAVGGSGTWSSTGMRWVNGSGRMLPVTTAQLVFGGSAGTVTVSGSQAVGGGLAFVADGYTLTGGTLSLTGDQTANTITVGTGTATLATTIAATGGLTKSGAGTLTLAGAGSAIDGPLAVKGGRLVIDPGAAGGFFANGKLQVTPGGGASAALEIVSGTNAFSSAGIAAIGDSSGTSTLDVKGGATTVSLAVDRLLIGNKGPGMVNVSGGSLALSGTGDVIIGGDSEFAASNVAGTVTVTGGTLSITGAGSLRMGVNITGTTTGAQGTVNLSGGVFETERPFTLGSGSGTINFNGGTLRALASSTSFMNVTTARVGPGGAVIDTGTNTVVITKPLVTSGSGSGGLTKLGGGTLQLSGSSTYTGRTSIGGGTLQLDGAGAIGGDIANQGILVFTKSGALSLSGAISGTGSLVQSSTVAAGVVTLSGPNSYKGGTTVTSGSMIVQGDQSAATGGWSLPNTPANLLDKSVTFAAGSTIVTASSAVVQVGNMTASGSNAASVLVQGSATNAGALNIGRNGTVTVASGGTWLQTGTMQVAGQGGAYATLSVNAGAAFTYAGGSTIKVNPMSNNSGRGVVTISGGTFVTNSGFEQTVSSTTAGGYPVINLQGGGVLRMSQDVAELTKPVASAPANLLRVNLAAGGGTIDTAGFNAGIGMAITGTAGLTKAGGGTLRLAGANTYTGPTQISAGTLAVFGNQSAATGAVTVGSGATLGGTGTVGGNTTIQSGATLAPGASPGTLTFTQGLTWTSGGNYNWQVLNAGGTAGTSGGWDLVSVAGTLSIASTAADPFRINLWTLSGISPDVSGSAANFDATKSATWRIANATGGISGFSADKFQIATGSANGTGGFANETSRGTFSLALSGSTGLDLVFTPVTTLTWYGNGATPGGSGTWTTGGANWHNGRDLGPWAANAKAVFSGSGGTVTVGPGVTAAGVQFSGDGSFTLSGTAAAGLVTAGLLDVGGGSVTVVAGLSPAELQARIVSGSGDGTWNGASGITSSAAAAMAYRSVGWLDNGDGSLTFGFAAEGDTNLDGFVDLADLQNILASGKYGTSSTAVWGEGDFNLDGVVNLADLQDVLASGLYGKGAYRSMALSGFTNQLAASLSTGVVELGGMTFSNIATVPEPQGMLLAAMGLAGAVLGACRRRMM